MTSLISFNISYVKSTSKSMSPTKLASLKRNSKLNRVTRNYNVTSSRSYKQNLSNFFPEFYGSYDYEKVFNENTSSVQLYGLFPSDYDDGLSNTNGSHAPGFYSENQNQKSILTTQLSAPLLYILFMFILYFIIISILFMSALYSHRKRVGYNYDENFEYSTQSDDCGEENLVEKNSNQKEFLVHHSLYDEDTDEEADSIYEARSLKSTSLRNNLEKYQSGNKYKRKHCAAKYLKKKNLKKRKSEKLEKTSFIILKQILKMLPLNKSQNLVVRECDRELQTNLTQQIDNKSALKQQFNKSNFMECPSVQPLLNENWLDENEF